MNPVTNDLHRSLKWHAPGVGLRRLFAVVALASSIVSRAGAQCASWLPETSPSYLVDSTMSPVNAMMNWDPDGDGPLGDVIVLGGRMGFGNQSACTSFQNLAVWDGKDYSSLLATPNAAVRALAVYQGKLHIAGDFTAIGNWNPAYVARFGESSWEQPLNGLNAPVHALCVYHDELIAGGMFTEEGTIAVPHIAAWNGASWRALGAGMDGTVRAVTAFNDQLIAGGDFLLADGQPASRLAQDSTLTGSRCSSLGDGTAKDGRR